MTFSCEFQTSRCNSQIGLLVAIVDIIAKRKLDINLEEILKLK